MRLFGLLMIISLLAAPAQAANPIVLFDAADTADGSFNTSVHEGLNAFEKFNDTEVAWLAPADPSDHSEKTLEELVVKAIEKGHDPIICVGFPYTPVLAKLAPAHPKTHFVLIDSVVAADNVQSIVFAEEQGSFLVGVLAAMASKSKVVGFVGGRDSAVIRNFACGFAQGVKYQSPDTRVIVKMAGTTNEAFRTPKKGEELTRELVSEGADVVFHAAGGTGNGVIAAAKDLGILAIGVDRNQNSVAPGTVLTSMLKKLDTAVFMALSAAAGNRWKPGVWRIGLEKDGVGWSLDEHNRALVSEAQETRMGKIRSSIISGELGVHRYSENNRCPSQDFPPLP